MPELLTALIIIGILAAAASPVFVRLMRDNRVASAATNFADVYRTARNRALGRGIPVMVRWDAGHAAPSAANLAGQLTAREAIITCEPEPPTGCTSTDWSEASANSKFAMSFDARPAQYQPNTSTFYDPANAAKTYAEICFTPRGRAFVRYAAGDNFAPLVGVPHIEVHNTLTSFKRQVVIPPNGMARVVTTL